MTTTISAMNGSLAQFKLETSRMVIEPLISECLSALEVEYGKNPLHDYIENNFDGVMEIFQYLKSLNVGNNERLILSRSKLASYLLSNALHATKGTDKGTLANHMTRHAKDLIFDKVKDIPLEVNKNTLAYLCTEAVLEQNNLQTERVEENNLLKLIDETAQLLYSKKHDFTGYETASRILEYYHSVVKQGFLPTYVEQYLTDIGATDEQKTPEVKQAMINYLMKSGLQSKQYAAGKDPWE